MTTSQPQPIRVAYDYVIVDGKKVNLGFSADMREERIASLIVAEAVRCGLNPYHIATSRRGDYLHIRQSYE